MSYCVNKDDGNRQTDRRTGGQTQVTTITLRPKRPRVKNGIEIGIRIADLELELELQAMELEIAVLSELELELQHRN